MTPNTGFNTDTDRSTVWIHQKDQLVARFGMMAYEIRSPSAPEQMLDFGRVVSAQSWLEFRDKVRAAYGFEVVDGLTPRRFHQELGLSFGYDSTDEIFEIAVSAITRFSNPLRHDVWGRGRVTRASVTACLDQNRLAARFIPMGVRGHAGPDWDSQRVAYFVANPDPWPISIEVTSPCGAWTIDDGFHRLAAAVYRRAPTILVAISGYIDAWDHCFPKRVRIKLQT
jgi:hypothetical protein